MCGVLCLAYVTQQVQVFEFLVRCVGIKQLMQNTQCVSDFLSRFV